MPSSEERVGSSSGAQLQCFAAFFKRWVAEEEYHLEKLLSAPRDHTKHHQELQDLIARVMEHHQTYYTKKATAANDDVLRVFSPTWLSSFENSLLWIGGWRPLTAFRIVNSNALILQLSPEQLGSIEKLKAEIKEEESELSEEMAKLQESMVNPNMLELARRAGGIINGVIDDVDAEVDRVMEVISAGMLVMLEGADRLRMKTARKMVEILNPLQSVDFLAASIQFFLQIHSWGYEIDAERCSQ